MVWNNFSSLLEIKKKENRLLLGIVLTTLGLIFWLYVLATYRVWWVPPSNTFGLYQVIPIWFWVGIISLVCGMLIMIDCSPKYYFIFQFIALNLMVWATPVFIEPNARVTDTWVHFGRTNIILDTGHISSSSTVGYLEWPGSFIFNAVNLQVIGVNFMQYLKYYPLLSSTIFILGYYLLVRKIVKDEFVIRFSLLLQIPLNIWLQFHFSPQSFALMIFPLIMLGFLKNDIKWWIATGILCVILIISHPTTSIFLGSILITVFLITIILYLPLKRKGLFRQGIILLVVLVGTILIFYLSGSLSNILSSVIENIGNLPDSITTIFEKRTSDTPSLIRMVIFVLMGILSLISMFLFRKDNKLFRLCLGWIIGITLVFAVDISLPGAHFHNRALFYFYFIFPVLISLFVMKKIPQKKFKPIIAVFLVILSLLNLSTIFYTENEAIISDSNLSAVDFVITTSTNETIYIEQAVIIRAFAPERDVRGLSSRGTIPKGSILIFDEYAMGSKIVGSTIRWRYEQLGNESSFDLVYSNNIFEAYYYNIEE